MKSSAALRLKGAAVAAVLLAVAACGGSGGNNSPTPSVSTIQTPDGLVDVGNQVLLDGRSSFDPTDQGLSYFWTLLRPADSDAAYQDHCEEPPLDDCAGEPIEDCVIPSVCIENDDNTCQLDDTTPCTTNADCQCPTNNPDCGLPGGNCDPNSGTMSPQCATGPCNVGEGREMDYATFVADTPGPFTVRLVTQATNGGNDVATRIIRTNPSLFVVGSLIEFGGTGGALIGVSSDAEVFAPGSTAGAASPVDGNIVLAVPSPASVREFDYSTGDVVGAFGETTQFIEAPVALAFDEIELWVAYTSGTVRRFDASSGLFINVFGDVTAAGQSRAKIAVSPDNGNLFVADPTPGNGVREYQRNTGAGSPFGDTAAAVSQATDLAFRGDPVVDVLIADGTGDVIRCNPAGTGCAPFGTAAAALAGTTPTAIAVNPSSLAGDAAVLIAAPSAQPGASRVVACSEDGSVCTTFGDTGGATGSFSDILFAPPVAPTTTTTLLFPASSSTTISTTSMTSSTTLTTETSTSTSSTTTTTLPPTTTMTTVPTTTTTFASTTTSTAAAATTTTIATGTGSP